MTITIIIDEYLDDVHGTDVWFHLNSQVSCLEKVIVKLLNQPHMQYNSNSHHDDVLYHYIHWDTTINVKPGLCTLGLPVALQECKHNAWYQ